MSVGWSDLSTALKQNVIRKLDLISRHSMRSTCRLNRFVVDFTEFFVPRVRVSIKEKESGILIMIHTGIDKFLRMEMWIGPQGKTIVRKLQNSYDPKEGIEKVLPSTPRFHAAQILCGLLSREKTVIGVMEWEIERGIDVNNQEDEQFSIQATTAQIITLVNFLQKYSDKPRVFRANKLVTSWNLDLDMEAYLKKMFVPDDLKKIERIGLMTSEESLTPQVSCDSYVPLSGMGIPCGTNTILHKYTPVYWNMFIMVSIQSPGFAVLRFAKFDETTKQLWNSVEGPIEKITDKKYRKVSIQPTYAGDVLIMHERSPCGYWVFGILEKNQTVFEDYFRFNFSCGLGWLCKKCTDPFEYNYHQNLGRRMILEPKWNGILRGGFEKGSGVMNRRKDVGKKCYEEDERKKERDSGEIQKTWGFGKKVVEDSEDSEDSEVEEISRKISEDVKEDSGMTDESDSEDMDSEEEDSEDSEDVNSDESLNSEDSEDVDNERTIDSEKEDSEDSEDVATPESDEFTNFMKLSKASRDETSDRAFQKWAILITGFAFLTSVLYAIFSQVI